MENLWITVLQSLNVLHTDVQKIDYELHAIQHSSVSSNLDQKYQDEIGKSRVKSEAVFCFCRQVAILNPSGVLPSASKGLWFHS